MSRSAPPIQGQVAPGFEPVREEFERSFRERGEHGAACALYFRGEKVVDLWGGHRDRRRTLPWEEDTMCLVFSTSKGMAAMTMALAHSRGWFEPDEPVAKYWPEFGQNGKEEVTIRQLLSHQAGLCAIDARLDAAVMADPDAIADAMARQRPWWTPGTRNGYHAFSIGFSMAELLRRLDPRNRSLGRFFREEIAQPLGIDFYFGLPSYLSDRVAPIDAPHPVRLWLGMRRAPVKLRAAYLWPGSLTFRTFSNPRFYRASDLDRPEYRAVEMPAAGGIGEARAIARAYSVFAEGGAELGITPRTMELLTAPPRMPSGGDVDMVLRYPMSFSMGYGRPGGTINYGSSPRSFGTMGAGGSLGFADPDARVAYSYVMNKMGLYMYDDPREKAVRDACYRCIQTSVDRAEIPEPAAPVQVALS